MKHQYDTEEDDDDLKVIVIIERQVGDVIQGRFSISQKIGEGSFGQVYKVVDQKNDGQTMAMKVEVEEEDYSMLEKEIKVLIEMRYSKLNDLEKKQDSLKLNFMARRNDLLIV